MSAMDQMMTGRGMTMSDQLARHARKTPDEVALRFDGAQLTYGELDERVSRLANALDGRGVAAGDRVAVLGLNRTEVVEAYLACTRLGAICVPLNFRLVASEVAYALTDSGAVAVVVDAPLAKVMREARADAPDARVCLVIDGGDAGPGSEDYEEALRASSPSWTERVVDEQGPAFIMYTSGTTGRPKGAVLTHHNMLLHSFSQLTHLGVPADSRVAMLGVPLFHIAGVALLAMAILRGGRVVLTRSGQFDPEQTVALWERERVASCFLVPAQWQAVCSLPNLADYDLSALHQISWGAAPASTTLLRTMIDTFPQAEVVAAFGQTECSPVTCLLQGEDSIRKIGSVGTPMMNVEVRVVDDDMNDVPVGEVGEIVYRGPMVMKEYWNKPEETAEAFRGGWFHSGDLVRQDEDGFIYVVDRKKDMIISGGENIYCAEVENVIAGHPKVAEVAVIGVPDDKWGETPLAVIAPRDPADPPTPQDIDTWCAERLARYKRPRQLTIVPMLPRNASGKVLKTELRTEQRAGKLTAEPI